MANVAPRNVTKVFPGGTVALDDVSLDVADGELVVLLGPSGCGKSTLLRIVAGLEDPTAGSVLLDGEPADELPPWERGVAMVFQHYALYPHMSVGDNIGFPLKVSGLEPVPRRQRTEDAASALGIADLLDRRTTHLSGGQRQRVAMGRAIIRDPRLFLLDEPLSNLDSGLRAELRTEISALSRQLGATSIYVTHDRRGPSAAPHPDDRSGRRGRPGRTERPRPAPPQACRRAGAAGTLPGDQPWRTDGGRGGRGGAALLRRPARSPDRRQLARLTRCAAAAGGRVAIRCARADQATLPAHTSPMAP